MYKQGIRVGLDKNNGIVFSDDCNRYRMGCGQQIELGVVQVTNPTSPYGTGPWQSWSNIPTDHCCPCKTCNCCGPNYVCYFHDVYNNCDK